MKRFLLCLALIAFAIPAHAAIQQVRVTAVGIDRSASKAETLALDYARKRAVYLTARKLPIDNPGARVAAFTDKQMHDIVRGAEITQVKRQGEYTYADVTVSIVDAALKRALGLPEVAPADEVVTSNMRSILVLPVYVSGGRPYMWEKQNALRDPLRAEILSQGHGSIMVSAGDLDDLRLIDYSNALSVNGEELRPMFERYGADEIIIAIYSPAEPNSLDTPPSILLRRLTQAGQRTENIKMGAETEKLTSSEQLKAAASLIAGAITQIASATASDDQAKLAKATKLQVTFKYANPRELAQMQQSLRSQTEVLLIEYPSIGLGSLAGTAFVHGDLQKLREKLRKTGMLVTDAGEGWQLSLR